MILGLSLQRDNQKLKSGRWKRNLLIAHCLSILAPTWRTHSCVPRRVSTRRSLVIYTTSEASVETNRRGTQECARHEKESVNFWTLADVLVDKRRLLY